MKGKKIKVPTYLCGRCSMTLRYHIVCHYTIETDKEHVCKPILPGINEKEMQTRRDNKLAGEQLRQYNDSLSYTDKQKILQIDNNKPITGNWRKKVRH